MTNPPGTLDDALRIFGAAEANLAKLERLWKEIHQLTPSGIEFGRNVEYDDRARSYRALLAALPLIEGWKPEALPTDLDDLAQWRLDAHEVGEIEAQVSVERAVEAPGEELAEYRFRLDTTRRALIRQALVDRMQEFDDLLESIRRGLIEEPPNHQSIESDQWTALGNIVKQIELLLGSSVGLPPRWSDLRRHLHFALYGDFLDIEKFDWPQSKAGLMSGLYGANEPIPVDVEDLGTLVGKAPSGPIATELKWAALSAANFERLVFALIAQEGNYENAQWLTHPNAPDRGRDLSAQRVFADALTGKISQRVIIQCRHRAASVGVADMAELKEQMKLWEPPKVDLLIIATTGRFTTDAVAWIERHNQSDSGLRFEMWPDSHFEHLLASRPSLIAEFGLR
jgi:hypothetical protein